jgi:hypothetical protein
MIFAAGFILGLIVGACAMIILGTIAIGVSVAAGLNW